MKAKSVILTKEERDVLVLAFTHPRDQHLNNTEIGQLLGMSVSKVKMLIYQACIKLGAQNRNEAILFAMRRGEIRLDELYTLDELAEFYSSLSPDMFRRIAHSMHEGLEHRHFPGKNEQTILMDRSKDTILAKSEKDVLILIGRGLTDREIADTLNISVGTVRTFLYRAYTKLGVRKRTDALMSALKRGEIAISEIYSLNELLEFLTPLGSESIIKIAQVMSRKLELKPSPTGS